MKPGSVEAQLRALREQRWNELHPETVDKPKPVDIVDTVDTKPVDRREYQREWLRQKRARAKLTAAIDKPSGFVGILVGTVHI